MNRLRNNIIANFGGQAWAVVMGLAFVPLYIGVLGVESYGLIGFFLSLQAVFLILDMGLAATLNRELARAGQSRAQLDDKRDLVRTLELIYWLTGGLIAIGVFFLSGPIASQWLKPDTLSAVRTAGAIQMMGLAVALQWPSGLYVGGIRGLERQVLLNGVNSAFATLRGVGSVAVLLLVSPSIEAFFSWHIFVALAQTLAFRSLLWRSLPSGSRPPSFRLGSLKGHGGFAMGMTGIVFLSLLLVQADKLILSTLLPLKDFGYYTLAAIVAASLSSVVQPFFSAIFPRFSRMVVENDKAALVALYHQSNQLLAAVVAPIAAVLAFFSVDVIRMWTGNAQLAQQCGPLLSILVIGTALHGLMHLPYALQLAYGWTRLAFFQNLVAASIAVPLVWILASKFGGVGAAAVWLAVNLGYVMISIPIMHRNILVGEMSEWYLKDIAPLVVVAVSMAALARALIQFPLQGISGLLILTSVGCICLSTTALASPRLRAMLRGYLNAHPV